MVVLVKGMLERYGASLVKVEVKYPLGNGVRFECERARVCS